MLSMVEDSIYDIVHALIIHVDEPDNGFGFKDNIVVFSSVLSHVCGELNRFYNIGLNVSSIKDESESMHLFIELSGFLRELGCPYTCLTENPLDTRFSSDNSINLLLTFLLTELIAARVIAVEYPDSDLLAKPLADISSSVTSLTEMVVPALKTLSIKRPPENVTIADFFGQLELKLNAQLPTIPKFFLGKSMMESLKPLSVDQWQKVDILINAINDDHYSRRQTLIQRFDVTVQSLKWSPNAAKAMDKILEIYSPIRKEMDSKSLVSLSDVLAARDYPLALIVKTCNKTAREKTACELNRILIGPVPDRGGRPAEMEVPRKESAAFQQKENAAKDALAASRGRGRGGGRGGGQDNHRGGRGGGQDNQWGARGGSYDNQRGGSRGGSYDNQRGGGKGDSRGNWRGGSRGNQMDVDGWGNGTAGTRYHDNSVVMHAQSVAPTNYHNQFDQYNQYSQPFQPQFENPRGEGQTQYRPRGDSRKGYQ